MWKLTIEDDQASKTVVHLVRDEYTIGRAEDNAIRLTERNISRRHARVQKDSAGVWHLYDEQSYNGCYVNGQRVGGKLALAHGDLVQFGDYRLIVEDESSEQARNDRVQTVPGLPRLNVSTQSDRLIELVGPEPGTEFALSQRRLIVGRGEECDISINHPSVSRVHAEIIPFGDGRYEVRDLQSANGVRVNGVELPQSLLDARDVLELGDVLLKYIPAGELYIPGADDTQARAALAAAPRGLSAWPAAAKVAVGGVLVALALALVLALRGGGQTQLATVENSGGERAAKLLAEARSLLEKGDTEGAIAKANAIPQDSNLRDSAEFRAIHGAWADSLFEQAANAPDLAQKRSLLDQIARATSVDSTRRKRAAKELENLVSEAVDVSALPSDEPEAVAVAARPQVATGAPRTQSFAPSAPASPPSQPSEPPAAKTTSTSSIVRKNPFDSSGASDLAPPPTVSGASDTSAGERSKLVQAKNQLKSKVASGQATERDLKMLKALCQQLGDASCSN
jgi:pSer/pThr/pTyr-binding forkhead associated (FHA) protein